MTNYTVIHLARITLRVRTARYVDACAHIHISSTRNPFRINRHRRTKAHTHPRCHEHEHILVRFVLKSDES